MSIFKSKAAKLVGALALSGTMLATGLTVASYADNHRDGATRTERAAAGFRAGERFARADVNGDRVLTVDEFQAPSAERFADADADGDGNLTAEEIIAARTSAMAERIERRAARMIERLDTDGDGVVSMEESEAATAERFARLDRNDDGELEPRELRRGMRGGDRGGEHRGEGRRMGAEPQVEEQAL